MHKKIMFYHYYCTKTHCKARKLENVEEMASVNLCFCWLETRERSRFTAYILKVLLPGQRHVFTFATLNVTDADFGVGPEILTVETSKPCMY